MASIQQVLSAAQAIKASNSLDEAKVALTKAKKALLQARLLTPPLPPANPASESAAARKERLAVTAVIQEVYELGALVAIRGEEPLEFERYVFQAKMCYEGTDLLAPGREQMRKVMGLYLLLLLSRSDYAGFNAEMEPLLRGASERGGLAEDRFLGYPIQLERWLSEGRYDMMWKGLQSGQLPCPEYSFFTQILQGLVRSEIATSSECAYDSMSIQSAKSLLFMESEGAVIQFARSRGWRIEDGLIIFPTAKEIAAAAAAEMEEEEGITEGELDGDKQFVGKEFIAGVQGYAKILESIV